MLPRVKLIQVITYRPHGRVLCQSRQTLPPSIRCQQRSGSTHAIDVTSESREAWLFVDSVFPIQIARWDFRHYFGILREEHVLEALQARLAAVTVYDFRVLSLETHRKDGGVFVRFAYSTSDAEVGALKTIESQLTNEVKKHGGVPSWLGLRRGKIWIVKGMPWREDMNRYASPILKVSFEGSDVQEQTLYKLFRPFGHIQDLTQPVPAPTGALRSSIITFSRLHSATIARNVIHGLHVPSPAGGTRLRAAYQRPVQAHVVRGWMSSHPKIMIPLLVFLLGSVTYAIFDPIRSLMIQGRMLDWFDYREFQLYKWLRLNTLGRLSHTFHLAPTPVEMSPTEDVWRERGQAVSSIRSYLSDLPSTVAFIHGPQGSGKSRMLDTVLSNLGRRALVIDCRSLQKTTSDTQMVATLAAQTGYWPVFTFMNSLNNLVDLASVGLIGQKAGLSSSMNDELERILSVVGTALKSVGSSHRANIQRRIRNEKHVQLKKEVEKQRKEKIRRGTWHDARLDCVAGNGIMSELGIGDELMLDGDGTGPTLMGSSVERCETDAGAARRQRTKEEIEAVRALPIVVIRNYASKLGSHREDLLTVLAQWAAMLVENQLAHVIVISDNRENFKYLAKALPYKPLTSIALSDADSRSSVSFIKQKLHDVDIEADFTAEQAAYVERLGGRASDLESLIHKVRNGQRVEEAVDDIITRDVEELRKNAFEDDIDDAKNLQWTREQVWAVLKLLSKRPETPYHEVLLEFPFKGDETALRSMEHAEIISITTHDGRPSTIRPGKPIFRWVFQRLVNDPVFRASQDIAFNERAIANSEKTIIACEEELKILRDIATMEAKPWWHLGLGQPNATATRSRYLSSKMLAASRKIELWEKQNQENKKILTKGG